MSIERLPPPPWSALHDRRPKGPAKTPITRASIVAAALALLDAEGLAGVSMRRVADQLGTGPASLYQHVASKDELLELLLDHVTGEVEVSPPDPDDWQTPLKESLRSLRRVLASHRDIAYVTMGRIPTGENTLTVSEGLLAIMVAGGVPGSVASFALDGLALFIGATAYEESIQQKHMGTLEEAKEYVAMVRDYFAALPPDRFPTLVALTEELTQGSLEGDERFEFQLDVHIRGIAALAAQG